MAVRDTAEFDVTTVHGIHHRHVRPLQRADGHAYITQREGGARTPA
ncbi:hypothetical protein [Nocardiopsis sp. CNR-923]|nr:hypothetical protein [Nocardiopsis sp. CNR-923]